MNRRYAVLLDVEPQRSREAALVVERDGYVLVDASSRYCLETKQRGEYRVGNPDGTLVTYRPGDEQYFDHLLISLSNTFAIGEEGVIDDTTTSVTELYMKKISDVLLKKERGAYSPTSERYEPRVANTPSRGHALFVA